MKTQGSLGIIGAGRMGGCILSRLIETSAFASNQLFLTTKHPDTAEAAAKSLGVQQMKGNAELAKHADIIILAVKPQNVAEVLSEIAKSVTKQKTVISIIASISTEQIAAKLPKGVPILRAMPNTPSFIGEGITALCKGASAGDPHWEIASRVFAPLGPVVKVDERHMDAVTGLSGCGPAYVYVILESLTEAGIKVGLPRDLATKLAAQTVLGAAKMLLVTGRHPAALKDEVTTPAGCTIDGLLELEEGKLRVTLMKAVVRASERATALSKQAKL